MNPKSPARPLFLFLRRGAMAFALMSMTLFASVFPGCERKSESSPDVIVLHSGRIRGNVYPTGLQSIAPLQHYQYLAGYVNKVRQEAARTGAKVVLVDLGDSLGGSFASHATGHGNMITFFNEVGYDAVVLGNLDNNIQPETLAKLKAKVLCPFQGPEGRPATEGTAFGALLDIGGIPVEILSNFYGDTSSSTSPERFPTWFGNTAERVSPVRDYKSVVDSLPPRPSGALTLLTWMKFESPANPPAPFLASLHRLGVNAILAHRIYSSRERDVWSEKTFYDWQPPVSENILRNNGGFALGRLDLKRDGKGWKVLRQELVPMTANTAEADPAIKRAIDGFTGAITAADQPVGELAEAVSEEKILTAYMTSLTVVPGTEVVAYSRESIRTDWPQGPLHASRVFNSIPWTTAVVQMTLTPEQMEQLRAISGIFLMKRTDAPSGAPLTVTTSRFFASLLANQLGLPADSIRDTGVLSEFDHFVEYLKRLPQPLTFAVPDGWQLEYPRT